MPKAETANSVPEHQEQQQSSRLPVSEATLAGRQLPTPEAAPTVNQPRSTELLEADSSVFSTKKNPLAAFSPQGKLLAALVLVIGIVVSTPHSVLEVVAVLALIGLVAVTVEASLGRLLLRSLVVLPVAGAMALLVPLRFVTQFNLEQLAAAYQQGLALMLQLIITPWLSVLVMLALALTVSLSDLLYALQRLRVPQALILLLTFIYRYFTLLRGQLVALQRSLVCRAPLLSRRRQVLLYGNLAGTLLVRAQVRGERIHAAMLSRGFTGSLPRRLMQRFTGSDGLLLAIVILLSWSFYWL